MTPDPEDQAPRRMEEPVSSTDERLEAASNRGDDAPDSTLEGPRRSRGSLSGSMPALRGPRDRGRRN